MNNVVKGILFYVVGWAFFHFGYVSEYDAQGI